MTEIRFHGRGGQGTVVASQILAAALFKEGKFVQAFPAFGVERRGAPVAAFIRVSDRPILLRCEIYRPDHLVVLDPTLIYAIDVTSGLKEHGWIIINSDRPPESEEFDLPREFRVATVDANRIALAHHLGNPANPIVNTAILGAFAKITGLVGLEPLLEAIREEVPLRREENVAATLEAYEEARAGEH
ncbi:TPA: pyruvate ferredoxin oxidoreductase [Candidatus Bipolaricaulota bacterium]|nr:pyruvate ferredoxin oxidoreductase [Candidatus Bipolaricaulota bacterium]